MSHRHLLQLLIVFTAIGVSVCNLLAPGGRDTFWLLSSLLADAHSSIVDTTTAATESEVSPQ